MAKAKALFFIPVHDNDGRDLNSEISHLEMELYVRFVGWTDLGLVKGAYRMATGTPAVDHHRSYAVVLDEDRIPELEGVLKDFKGKTLQEAIYLEIQWDVDVRYL